MLRRTRTANRAESGFTLIELLIVIVILGVLAAVVVFAVGGINDRGTDSACRADLATVTTAAEAYNAQNGEYAPDMDTLVEVGLLKSLPSTKNYQIVYGVSGKGADQRAEISSTSCDVQSASSAPSSDTQETRDRYCKTFEKAIRSFSEGVSFQALDVDEFARATRIFEGVEAAATNDIRNDWALLTGALHSMQSIVVATGLNPAELKELSDGQLPKNFTQEEADQLNSDLAAQLQGKRFQRSAQRITEHARSTCGMNIG